MQQIIFSSQNCYHVTSYLLKVTLANTTYHPEQLNKTETVTGSTTNVWVYICEEQAVSLCAFCTFDKGKQNHSSSVMIAEENQFALPYP